MPTDHKQIPLAVKELFHGELIPAAALIDEGIAELVVALNELDRVYTTSSCQGGDDVPPNDADAGVSFRYLGTLEESVLYAARLGAALQRTIGQGWNAWLILRWSTEAGGPPMFQLAVPRLCVGHTAEVLRSIASELHTTE